jgi:hypothetical protein
MKHPEHDVSVSISTKEFTCPEFNVKVRNSAVHCIIPGYPTKRWFVTLKLAPICESEEKCTHYLVILPNNESQVVARPKWWPAFVTFFDHGPPVGEDSYLHLDSTPRFFCPPPGADTILPIHWMIQLRIFRATMVYYPRPAAERPLSGARTIMAWRYGKITRRTYSIDYSNEILYRFEYRCPASIRDCPAWNDIPMWFEEGNDEWGRDSSANQAPHHESEKQQVVDISYQMDEEVDPPPAYYRGPRPKNPPRSDLRIRDLYHNLEKNHIAWRKVRSPLAGPADKRCSTDLRGRATRPMVSPRLRARGTHILPTGWEIRYTDTYRIYFVNHNNRYTTWQDPRIPTPKVLEPIFEDDTLTTGFPAFNNPQRRLKSLESSSLARVQRRLRTALAYLEADIQTCWMEDRGVMVGGRLDAYFDHWFPDPHEFVERVAPSPYEEASTPLYRLIRRHNITVETLNFFLRREKDISRVRPHKRPRFGCIPKFFLRALPDILSLGGHVWQRTLARYPWTTSFARV